MRLALVIPPPRASRPRPLWRRIIDAVLGLEHGPDDEPGPLLRPFGVAVAPGGDVLVADPDVPLVARAGPNGSITPVSCKNHPWSAPMAVAYDSDGSIVVADAGAASVVRVPLRGDCTEMGMGELERPTGVAVSGGRLYVADPPRHAVVVLSSGGEVVARIGTGGEEAARLRFPSAVAIGPEGTLLVVDALNFRIVRFSPDGRLLGATGEPGDAGGAFTRPKGIAAGADGRVYVSDAQRDAVLVFLPDGSFDYAIGATGSEPGRFAHPAGLTISGSTLLVADSLNGRVQAFEILAGGRS